MRVCGGKGGRLIPTKQDSEFTDSRLLGDKYNVEILCFTLNKSELKRVKYVYMYDWENINNV